MTGILEEIVSYKRTFVAESKKRLSMRELEEMVTVSGSVRGFAEAIGRKGCALIAEIKTASPSKGIIRDDVTVEDVARIYEENGASCISVLTDERFFKGSLERLDRVRKVCSLPILRKDFIIDPYQIYEARVFGADAVLLIAAVLDDERMKDFIELSAGLSLDSLVEVHDNEEMARVRDLGVSLIGINNRNLSTFVTDLSATEQLASQAPGNALLVSESGINTADDVRTVHNMGADAVLVGEAIMRERNMSLKVRELSEAVPRK
ncbi:indole-3-glycerol phosphate synthase TrpC [bacterium]|nr:indole-3-glycerol phosphate synthase TrpC [bacterium]